MNRAVVHGSDRHGFDTIPDRQYAIAQLPQCRNGEIPNRLFVLHQQDRLGALDLRWNMDGARDTFPPLAHREVACEGRANTGLGVYQHMAVTLPDDSVHGRETQPRSFALLLGREEGLECMGQCFGRHAGTGVTHRHDDVGPWRHGRCRGRTGFVQPNVASLNREGTAMGHRITAVHCEIEQHLLDLTGIGHNRREIFVRRGHNSYRGTEEPAQHLLHVTHALVEAERLGVERLAAAECEKLAGQRTRAVARLDDLIYLTGPTRLLAKILAENVGVV